VYQHLEYFAFGETFVEEHSNTNRTPYLFNGKELDDETGLYYYGARYYDARTSIWVSVDPLADKMPSWSPYNYCFSNPVILADPDGRKPTPREAAAMAAHIYGDKPDKLLRGGWHVSTREIQGVAYNDPKTGLRSALYERTITSGKNKGKVEYAYVTAGTEAQLADVKADVVQPLGVSAQYKQSVDNARKISNELKKTDSELTYTGHSLGGGEAAANAYATGRDAITFNAAGVSATTVRANGGTAGVLGKDFNIDAYYMLSDPLNDAQDASWMMPKVNGERHPMMPTDFASFYNGHSMESVLKWFGLDEE
jgi:RHS repeat-associated protein